MVSRDPAVPTLYSTNVHPHVSDESRFNSSVSSNNIESFRTASDDDFCSRSRHRPIFETPTMEYHIQPRTAASRGESLASESTATSPSLSPLEGFSSVDRISQKGYSQNNDWKDSALSLQVASMNVEPATSTVKNSEVNSFKQYNSSRLAEFIISRIDCAQSEVAVRMILASIPGVTDVGTDPITSGVVVQYNPKKTSAWAMMAKLRLAHVRSVWCTVRSAPYNNEEESQISQLKVALPPAYQTRYGRTILQNHALAQDGIKSVIFSCDGNEMYIGYDSTVIGARQILQYISRAGVDVLAVDELGGLTPTHSSAMQTIDAPLAPNGGIKIVIFVALLLLWMDWSPPPQLQKCVLAGISATTLIQLVLCICAMTWLGIPYLIAGIWAVKQKLFTSYAALSLSAVLLFFVSSMGLVVAWLLPPLTGDQQLRCAGLGSTLCFDLTCWTLIAWCLGQNVSRWIKGQLAAPLCSLEKSLYPRGYIRLVGDGGKLDLVPKPLVQNGDVVVVRPGETLWCDGIAETEVVVKEPVVVSQMANSRPFTKAAGDVVYAGTLVMSGELRLRATKVGDTQLQKALLIHKMMSLKNSPSRHFIESYSRLYGLIIAVAGITVAAYRCFVFESSQYFHSTDANLIVTALQAISFASSVWLGFISLALSEFTLILPPYGTGLFHFSDSGSAAVASCSSGILLSCGGLATSSQSLPRASKTKHVVITRSALAGPYASNVTSVAICPTLCRYAVETLRLPSQSDKQPHQWRTMVATSAGVHQSNDVHEELVGVIWSIIGHLEDDSIHGNTRTGQLLRCEAAIHGAPSVGLSPSVRVFPGKGVEGPAPGRGDSTSVDEESQRRRCVAAVGSLEFILACHQFGLDKREVSREAKSEWTSLQRWCEQTLSHGDDIIVVAYGGLPLGAVAIHTDYGRFLKPAFQFISENLSCPVWIATSANLLSARALSTQTGIPLDRIVSGASPSDKVRFVEQLANREGQSVAVVTSSSTLVQAISRQQTTMKADVVTILTGADLSRSLPQSDVIFPGYTITGLMNLLVLSRMTKSLQMIELVLSFIILPSANIVLLSLLPASLWRFFPLVGISAAIGSEWIVLLIALLLRTLRPATVARSMVSQVDHVEKIVKTKTVQEVKGVMARRNPGELVLPEKPKMFRSALGSIASWIYRTAGKAKHMMSGRNEEYIDNLLPHLQYATNAKCLNGSY